MFENPRRSRQARNFTTNAPKILDLKSSSEQIFSRKLPLGAPEIKVNSSRQILRNLTSNCELAKLKDENNALKQRRRNVEDGYDSLKQNLFKMKMKV